MRLLCLDVPVPGATFEQYQPHLLDEVHHAWNWLKSGVIREIYMRQDRPGVAIFLEADSVEAAQTLLKDLPLVSAGLITFDVIPLGGFANWELLFAATPVPAAG